MNSLHQLFTLLEKSGCNINYQSYYKPDMFYIKLNITLNESMEQNRSFDFIVFEYLDVDCYIESAHNKLCNEIIGWTQTHSLDKCRDTLITIIDLNKVLREQDLEDDKKLEEIGSLTGFRPH